MAEAENEPLRCTACREPFLADREEMLTPGDGPRHRRCPTLADWREQSGRLFEQLDAVMRFGSPPVLKAERDTWRAAFEELAKRIGKTPK